MEFINIFKVEYDYLSSFLVNEIYERIMNNAVKKIIINIFIAELDKASNIDISLVCCCPDGPIVIV
jgi:hypothetical protein